MNIAAPSRPTTIYLHIKQGSTGGALTYPSSNVKWIGGMVMANTTTSNTGHDMLMIHYYGGTNYVYEMMQDLK